MNRCDGRKNAETRSDAASSVCVMIPPHEIIAANRERICVQMQWTFRTILIGSWRKRRAVFSLKGLR
jgi:hypothetical protein